MDAKTETLIPAETLAREGPIRVPGESAEYRAARMALLAEEIELRRHIERVAAQRRALPPGALVSGDYRFMTEAGETDLAGLFGDKQTLVTYSYMFGPQRERPCPMCTNLLDAWEGNADDMQQRIALAVVARSPLERMLAWKQERGWKNLRLVSDVNGNYIRDYFGLTPDGSEVPAQNVFTKRDGALRHFWSAEITTSDPGQDARGAPDPAPLWTVLDQTPEGRG
ncbi:MAG TPA: DUF899 family protein, partial [Caulobacteraceae bacterium]|nr:DUF899 family protein [Caulobacteraceae bacterium]